MNITLWNNFTKKRNSTKQPATLGTSKTVLLKEETSIEKPSFILNEPMANWTYASAFGKYYFVTDVINLDGYRSEIVCDVDTLATYKSDITSYTAFVERSASSYDVFLNDSLVSTQQKMTLLDYSSSSMTKLGGSCFVAQVLSANDGVVLYATPDLTPYAKLLTPSTYTSDDVLDWIDSKIAQAFDLDVYIGSIKWLPINANQIGDATNDFWVGPIEVGVPSGYTIRKASQTNSYRDVIYNATIPSTNKFGDFRDTNPRFSRYTIRLPGVGLVEVDPVVMGTIINDSTLQLNIQMDIDYVSGDIVYYLLTQKPPNTKQTEFARYRGNISVDVPIAKSVADFGKSVGTFTSAVSTGAVAGGWVGAIVGGVVGTVGAIANELTPDTSMIGGGGNKSDISYTSSAIRIYVEHYGSKDFPTTIAGRPLMQNVSLSTLSGYVKCGNASVPLNAHEEEMNIVNNFLNSGFYIE